MPLHVVAKGALIGGGVGVVLAAARRGPEEEQGKTGRVLKSAAEGALAGATVGFFLDRSLRARATELAVEAYETARPLVLEAYETARPRVVEAYETARPRVIEAYEAARPVVEDAVETVRTRASELRSA